MPCVAASIDRFEKRIRPKRERGVVRPGQQANYKIGASWCSLNDGANTMNYKTLVAASLMSIALTSAPRLRSAGNAQCFRIAIT